MLNLSMTVVEQDTAGGEAAVCYITHPSRIIHQRGKVGCNRLIQSEVDFVCVLNKA